ncbi:MAG: RNA polymerase-binding protein DksA [Deltaproteobacteria bacterium]|nr:RNA polymerase-binding protein DksA [Deltaproteobacteria bacterium]
MEKKGLREFNQILLSMKQKILEESGKLSDHFQSEGNKNLRLSDPNDRASMETNASVMLRLGDRNRKLLLKIEKALKKIKDGTYGLCEICGEEISEERLRFRPVTTQCIKCKTELESEEDLMKKKLKRWRR